MRWLGTERLTFRDLWVIVRCAPRESLLVQQLNPELRWGDSEHLLAVVADGVHTLAWQNAGGKRHNKPDPLPRPGDESKTRKLGTTALPMDEMAEILGLPMPA